MLNHRFQPPGSGLMGDRDPWSSRWCGIASSILLVISLLPGCAGSRGNGGSAPGTAPAASQSGSGATAAGAVDPDSLPQLSPAELAALQKGPPELRGTAILFTYVSRRARTVAVAGTFNGWIPTANPMVRRTLPPIPYDSPSAGSAVASPDSLWYALVPVPRGGHRYKFLVDGNRWLVDPANPKQAGDGSGGVASVLTVR